ncbi:VWA domain-containing protein [Myxococcota bacterium]|nr:VWA domain-containing protein [Myxococcota bacterium]MBU1431171.1 VWA domain-containing protein [Myxococcota bacterium]MBU1896731.1 VWA domain-containing protein [Myxococcota bacterium]
MLKAPLLALIALTLPSLGHAEQVRMDAQLASPVMIAGQKHTTHLKVGLTGFEIAATKRTPVNVAIVIDKSGSMAGEKMRRAKEAAIMAVERLSSEDIISVIAYDNTVRVIVPATKATDRDSIRRDIQRVSPGGNTALFAGVSKGAHELRKFLDRNRVNRVILLSDGLANVGPSSPSELATLGMSLAREGIAITTLGLGLDYNEDIMSSLARVSDGNHVFVEQASDLTRFFDLEFGEVLSVVAQDVSVEIHCAPGVRPIRVLGREADIVGQDVTAKLNQLYSGNEKFVMLEVEITPEIATDTREIASVKLNYNNTITKIADEQSTAVKARFTSSPEEVKQAENRQVAVQAVELIANDNNRQAVALRDKGKTQEARAMLLQNAVYLEKNADKLKSKSLKSLKKTNMEDADELEGTKWNARRKKMRRVQHKLDFQQSF